MEQHKVDRLKVYLPLIAILIGFILTVTIGFWTRNKESERRANCLVAYHISATKEDSAAVLLECKEYLP